MALYAESPADYVCGNTAYGYDIQKFTVDAILFRETQCKKRGILIFNSVYNANLVGIR